MEENKQYTWVEDIDKYWNNASFDSIAECFIDAKATGEVNSGDLIYIGEINPYKVEVSARSVLEMIDCQAWQDGYECEPDWLDYESGPELDELSEALTECVNSWLAKTGRTPSFYRVINERLMEVD